MLWGWRRDERVTRAACPPIALLFAVELLNRALKQAAVTAPGQDQSVLQISECETDAADSETVSFRLGEPALTAEQRMWAYYAKQVAAGRSPSGAELDRVVGTHNYGRRVLRRWRRSGRLTEAGVSTGVGEDVLLVAEAKLVT